MSEDLREEGLVGREGELESMRAALSEGPCVVHLTGSPGSGKTALAVAAAKAQGSATIVRVAEASGLVEALVAQGHSGSLASFLAQATTEVVVLDGVDDSVETVRRELEAYVARGRRGSVVVTSSNDLGSDDVRLLVVASPLDRDASREVFVRRAKRARTAISGVLESDADALSGLLDRCEGSPLALVSAASRLGVLELGELAKRIESEASAVLAATPFDSSVSRALSRLPAASRRALLEASVFEGTFSLDDAEAVLTKDADAPAVVRIEDLVARGFLQQTRGERGLRLRTSFLVRSFVQAAEPGAAALDGARERHARHLARKVVARAAESGPFGRGLEVRDCLAAAIVSERKGASEDALELLAAVERIAPTALVDPRCSATLEAIVASAKASRETALEGRALLLRGRVAQFVGRADEALSDIEKALGRAKKAKDSLLEGLVLQRLGSLRADRGQAPEAVTLLTRSMALLEPRSWRGAVSALSTLGTAEMALGESTSARKRFLDALALRERHDDAECAGQEHSGIGATLFQEGRLDEAVASFDRARDLLVRTGPRDILGCERAVRASSSTFERRRARPFDRALVLVGRGARALARSSRRSLLAGAGVLHAVGEGRAGAVAGASLLNVGLAGAVLCAGEAGLTLGRGVRGGGRAERGSTLRLADRVLAGAGDEGGGEGVVRGRVRLRAALLAGLVGGLGGAGVGRGRGSGVLDRGARVLARARVRRGGRAVRGGAPVAFRGGDDGRAGARAEREETERERDEGQREEGLFHGSSEGKEGFWTRPRRMPAVLGGGFETPS